jgi:toxin ParE1/3/4
MIYNVILARRVERDFAILFDNINAAESQSAARWYKGLKRAILSLERMPARCPVTNENPHFRHLFYGRRPNVYRALFRIMEKKARVEVLHIRHGGRRPFKGM